MDLTIEKIQNDINNSLKKIADVLFHVSLSNEIHNRSPELRQQIINLAETANEDIDLKAGKINTVILTTELIDDIGNKISEIISSNLTSRYVSKTIQAIIDSNIKEIRELLKLYAHHFSSEENRKWEEGKFPSISLESANFDSLNEQDELKQKIKSLTNRIDELEQRHHSNRNKLDESIKSLSDSLTTASNQIDREFNELKKSISEESDFIEDHKNKIVELYNFSSGVVIGGSYSDFAEKETKLADYTRNASVILMLATVVIVSASAIESFFHQISYETLLSRILISIAISIPAAYLARESSKHRQQSYLYLQTYLDLLAVDPYIKNMEETDKYKIKALIANKIFSKPGQTGNQLDSYPINIQALVEKLIDSVAKSKNPKQD